MKESDSKKEKKRKKEEEKRKIEEEKQDAEEKRKEKETSILQKIFGKKKPSTSKRERVDSDEEVEHQSADTVYQDEEQPSSSKSLFQRLGSKRSSKRIALIKSKMETVKDSSSDESENDSDYEYTAQKTKEDRMKKSKRKKNKNYRRKNTDSATPKQIWRETHPDKYYETSDDSDEDTREIFRPPREKPNHFLGLLDNECFYCGALHFKGKHICCSNGRVFVPPYPKLPEPIQTLLFDINSEKRTKFLKDIITYNTCMSFASIQYQYVKSAPFGIQVQKVQGPVRHFSSAVFPLNPERPQFGNFYVYEDEEAVNKRMEHPFFNKLDREIVRDVTVCLNTHDPFAKSYKSMGSLIDALQADGQETKHVRLKIINSSEVNKEALKKNHPGIYRTTTPSKDFISVFYDCSTEQDIRYPGLVIYPKRSNRPPRSIFAWMNIVSPLCYPILFPRGEVGWSSKAFPLFTGENRKLSFKERLSKYAHEHPDEACLWDSENEDIIPDHIPSHSDPNLESSSENESDENEDPYSYHQQLIHIENEAVGKETDVIQTVERNGEIYPERRQKIIENAEKGLKKVESTSDLENDSGTDYCSSECSEEEENVLTHEKSIELENCESETKEKKETIESEVDVEKQPTKDPKRKHASFREYGLYIQQRRKRFRNRISASKKLGQLLTVDMFTRLRQFRASAIRQHHTEYLSSTRKKYLEALQRRADRAKAKVKIGCVTSVPATVKNSPRDLQQKFENTVTLTNKEGKPDIFLTYTTNTQWKEIQDNLPPGTTWADNPFLVNEVFKKKFDAFLEYILGPRKEKGRHRRQGGIFGKVRWYTYSIEFQQRGPPHAHLILSLKRHIKTAAEVDLICQAELPIVPEPSHPDYEEKKRLRQLVEDFMVHRPCENDRKAYCQQGKPSYWNFCKKHFPKLFNEFTKLDDRNYPELRRRDNGEFCMKKTSNGLVKADNRHVVSHNLELLSLFECHINVEIVSSLRVLKYIFKYLFKGFDRVLVEAVTNCSDAHEPAQMTLEGHVFYPKTLKIPKGALEERNREAETRLKAQGLPLVDENGQKVVVVDETTQIEDMRAATANEAAWEFMNLPRSGCSHTVVTVFVHAPQEEPIRIELEDEDQEKRKRQLEENEVASRLKAWFTLNQSTVPEDQESKTMTFDRLPEKFIYSDGKWRRRKIKCERVVGHIKTVSPRNIEQFAIRLLASNVKGATSFESLRTVNGEVQPSFAEACRQRGLMNSEVEWSNALDEAAQDRMPKQLRQMFVTILLYCAPKNPLELWIQHKDQLVDRNDSWSEDHKTAHALFHIQATLKYHGTSLINLGLPEVDMSKLPSVSEDSKATVAVESKIKSTQLAANLIEKLNVTQKNAFEIIMTSIESGSKQCFFIEGTAGSGKTFLYETLFHSLSSQGHKVLSVAHTGLAAILLPNGTTAHRTFCIPLITEENMNCKVELESSIASDLRQVSVVLWDECPMTDRRILDAVNKLFYYLNPENQNSLFGGVVFIFGGDFHQTLPIVPQVRDNTVLDYTIRRSELWKHLKVLKLDTNIRAKDDENFSNWLLQVGSGEANTDQTKRESDQEIELPADVMVSSERKLIEAVFGNTVSVPEIACSSAILCVDNKTALEVNEKVLKKLPGEVHSFPSIDTFDETRGFKELDSECYHNLTPSGMPPHILNLKVNAIVMLLRNLDVTRKLCNGTKLVVKQIRQDVLTCCPLDQKLTDENVVYIHRWMLTTSSAPSRELAFIRKQFPLRLSYAMTVNKAQGQSLKKVGLLLRTPCFTHGQFFVAVSRVRSFKSLFVYNSKKEEPRKTVNVVFRGALV